MGKIKIIKSHMQDDRVMQNYQFFSGIHKAQGNQQHLGQGDAKSYGGFEIDPTILMMKMNLSKQGKDSHQGQHFRKESVVGYSVRVNEIDSEKDKQHNDAEDQKPYENETNLDLEDSGSKAPQLKVSQPLQQTNNLNNPPPANQQLFLPLLIPATKHEPHPPQLLLTKKQIQQQKQHLNELKQKKREQQQKKMAQKLHLQQKARLQKLKQQSRHYQQMKKKRDKEIMEFKTQIHSLKKNKEKEVFRQKQKQDMKEIEEKRERQQKYYQQMMLEKERMERQMRLKEEEERQRKLEEEEQKKKELNYLKKINSTAYQKALRIKQQQQQQERLKISQIKHFLNERNMYQQNLHQLQLSILQKHQKHKPAPQKSPNQLKQAHRRLSTKAMSAQQIYKMGQEFMQSAHSTIDEELIQQSKMFLSEVYQPRSSARTEYKDYLREDRGKREKFFKSMGRLQINPEISELKKLIVKEENSPEKLLKAKLLTERIDFRVDKVKKTSLKLKADSIAAKLKVIQEFT